MLPTTDYGNIETTIDPVAEIIQTKTDIDITGPLLRIDLSNFQPVPVIFERLHPIADLPILVG